VKVRLSIRPDEDWEVDEDEIPGLRAQGFLVEGDAKATVDEEAAEREVARQRAADERAEAAKAGRGKNAGE
jgi:hypothetical protein